MNKDKENLKLGFNYTQNFILSPQSTEYDQCDFVQFY